MAIRQWLKEHCKTPQERSIGEALALQLEATVLSGAVEGKPECSEKDVEAAALEIVCRMVTEGSHDRIEQLTRMTEFNRTCAAANAARVDSEAPQVPAAVSRIFSRIAAASGQVAADNAAMDEHFREHVKSKHKNEDGSNTQTRSQEKRRETPVKNNE